MPPPRAAGPSCGASSSGGPGVLAASQNTGGTVVFASSQDTVRLATYNIGAIQANSFMGPTKGHLREEIRGRLEHLDPERGCDLHPGDQQLLERLHEGVHWVADTLGGQQGDLLGPRPPDDLERIDARVSGDDCRGGAEAPPHPLGSQIVECEHSDCKVSHTGLTTTWQHMAKHGKHGENMGNMANSSQQRHGNDTAKPKAKV